MSEGNLSYAVFYPAKSYEKTCDEINRDLPEDLNADNYPPANPNLSENEKKEEFLSLMNDEEHNVLMAWYGGKIDDAEKSNSSLELVKALKCDWDKITNSKKKIVGRSDITVLLCKLMRQGVRCYYGPNYSSLADDFKEDGCVPFERAEKNLETTKKYLDLALTATSEYVIDFNSQEIA